MKPHIDRFEAKEITLHQLLHAACSLLNNTAAVDAFVVSYFSQKAALAARVTARFIFDINREDPAFASAVVKANNPFSIPLAAFLLSNKASQTAKDLLCELALLTTKIDPEKYGPLISQILEAGQKNHRDFYSVAVWRQNNNAARVAITNAASAFLSRVVVPVESERVDPVLTPQNVSRTIEKAVAFAAMNRVAVENEVQACKAALDAAVAKRIELPRI